MWSCCRKKKNLDEILPQDFSPVADNIQGKIFILEAKIRGSAGGDTKLSAQELQALKDEITDLEGQLKHYWGDRYDEMHPNQSPKPNS